MDELIFLKSRREDHTLPYLLESAKKFFDNVRVAHIEEIMLKIGTEYDKKIEIYHNDTNISSPNYVFPRIDGIEKDKALKIISSYDLLDVKKVYGADALILAHDKYLSSLVFARNNIPTPKTLLVHELTPALEKEIKNIGFPLMAKMMSGTEGKGVMYIDDETTLKEVLETIKTTGEELMLQQFIKSKATEDIRVLVWGEQIIGAYKRVAKSGETRANISLGGKAQPYHVDDELAEIAIKAAKAINTKFAGVDVMEDIHGNKWVIEINIKPDMIGLINIYGKQKIDEIMELAHKDAKR